MTEQTSTYWNDWQARRNRSETKYFDWGAHPTILGFIYQDLFGSSDVTVFDYLKREYPWFPNATALSLCSGDGEFEKRLVSNGVFCKVRGIDISSVRVETAQSNRGEYLQQLDFFPGDVNAGNFGVSTYDVVFAKAALHHIENLEALFAGIRKCLKPNGRLVTIDFFGPTRLQWSEKQLNAANHFLANEIPEALLTREDNSIYRQAVRYPVEYMIETDPSEAVRSAEVYDQIKRYFDIEKEFGIGGTILNLIFDPSIINNFDPNNAAHNGILEKAFRYEKELIRTQQIDCDFKFIVAKA